MRLPPASAGRVWSGLRAAVEAAYGHGTHPMPRLVGGAVAGSQLIPQQQRHLRAGIPERGLGVDALPGIWEEVVAGSSKLASPWCMGHMDTAPHPAAALTDALVSALNNNLLFREISPLASAVEEQVGGRCLPDSSLCMAILTGISLCIWYATVRSNRPGQLVEELSTQLGLPPASPGVWCSGGSLANMTALFAAAGGYSARAEGGLRRDQVTVVMGSRGHASIGKACAVLGLPLVTVPPAPAERASGCVDAGAVEDAVCGALEAGAKRVVVVGVLGGTVNGHVDDLQALAGEHSSTVNGHKGRWRRGDGM
jgi:glutamate/tyrosine decarboxylase-like PLP-dependent enzyme